MPRQTEPRSRDDVRIAEQEQETKNQPFVSLGQGVKLTTIRSKSAQSTTSVEDTFKQIQQCHLAFGITDREENDKVMATNSRRNNDYAIALSKP